MTSLPQSGLSCPAQPQCSEEIPCIPFEIGSRILAAPSYQSPHQLSKLTYGIVCNSLSVYYLCLSWPEVLHQVLNLPIMALSFDFKPRSRILRTSFYWTVAELNLVALRYLWRATCVTLVTTLALINPTH